MTGRLSGSKEVRGRQVKVKKDGRRPACPCGGGGTGLVKAHSITTQRIERKRIK